MDNSIDFEKLYDVVKRTEERVSQAIFNRQENIKKEIDCLKVKIQKYLNDDKCDLEKICFLISRAISLEKEYKHPYRNLFYN